MLNVAEHGATMVIHLVYSRCPTTRTPYCKTRAAHFSATLCWVISSTFVTQRPEKKRLKGSMRCDSLSARRACERWSVPISLSAKSLNEPATALLHMTKLKMMLRGLRPKQMKRLHLNSQKARHHVERNDSHQLTTKAKGS